MLAPRRLTTAPFASTIWLPPTWRPPATGGGVGDGDGDADGDGDGDGDGAGDGDGDGGGVADGVGDGGGATDPPRSDCMVVKLGFKE
jgi:hypothetical protein